MPKTVGRILFTDHPIFQIFGVNPARYAEFGLAGHNGIDIAAPLETTAMAGVNGVVRSVGYEPTGYGRNVRVYDESQKLLLIFAHLNSIAPLIVAGARVGPTNPIGGTGNTGKSTGPHLHFGAADTDIAGQKINRENGYDGWKNPLDTNYLTLNYPKTFEAGATPPPASTTTTSPAPTLPGGATPPPYAPSFAGQTVSHLGNSFRSDNGSTWIFQGSDAERATAGEAEKKRQLALAESKATGAGVYLQKSNLLELFMDINKNASDFGLRDPENVIIKGPYKATLYEQVRGGGNVLATFSGAGTYDVRGKLVGSVRAEVILPPAPPPITEIPIPAPTITPVPSPTLAPAPPASFPTGGTEPWAGKKAPNHKDIYNKMAALFQRVFDALG